MGQGVVEKNYWRTQAPEQHEGGFALDLVTFFVNKFCDGRNFSHG